MIPQVVLITGASSGIGCATALAFAKRGSHVVALARRAERLSALEAEIAALPAPHGDCLPISADVADAEAMRSVVAQAMERFGRLDVLVANAGIGQRGALVDAKWEDLDAVVRINVDGVLHSIRAAVPAMRQSSRERSGGHIVIVSSVVHNMITPYAAIYSATKAFVSSIARSLRYELEPDHITVTELLVGRTRTEFHERRLGSTGYADKAPRIPVMTASRVADGIVRATERRSKTVVLRLFDRLILLGNLLLADYVARRALRQYRTR